jgi:hypothetical protein
MEAPKTRSTPVKTTGDVTTVDGAAALR